MAHFLEPEIAQEKGRVTAGVPALTPSQRAKTAYRERQRVKSRALANEAEGKEQAAKAPDAERPRTNKAAAGMYLQPDVLMSRLTRLTSRLYFERANADHERMGVYLLTNDPKRPKQYICAFHCDQPVPEFAVLEEVGPQRTRVQLMGWRNILLRLMKMGLISLTQAQTQFGLHRRPISRNWKMMMSR